MKHNTLDTLFNKMIKHNNIRAVSLSTVDGFTIHSVVSAQFQIENDKLSAVVSSLSSLSDAASQQVINAELVNTVIETKNGDIIIVKMKYRKKQAVLCVITAVKQNLGRARYYALKLGQAIENMPV